MEKKKRSFGSLFLGFIMGFVSFILILVLIVSVGINILFYSSESAPKIDFSDYHYTFFVNNCNDLANIGEGSLVFVDHNSKLEENTYVLCSIGSGYKTVLCLSSITENANGSLSYNLRGDKQGSEINYSVPESKILGTVFTKVDIAGDIIRFAKEITGIATLMAIPSFLLIIISIASIRRKKARYDDELLEAEIFIGELRKAKRNEEKKREEFRRKPTQTEQFERFEQFENFEPETPVPPAPVNNIEPEFTDFSYEAYTRKEVSEPVEETTSEAVFTKPQPVEVNKYEYVNFEDEASRKAIEIKNALLGESNAKPEVSEPVINKSYNTSVDDIIDRVQNEIKSETADKTKPVSIYSEQIDPSSPVYQKEPVSRTSEPVSESVHFVDYTEIKRAEESKRSEELARAAESIAPVVQSVQTPVAEKTEIPVVEEPVQKKPARPVKKLDAESIDDLIRIIEAEKKKLD